MNDFVSLPAPVILASLGFGLVIGSFLNVVIYRGPRLWGLTDGEPRGSLAVPGSYCPACRTPLPWFRLIPILSYVLQKGRCANCGAKIPIRYPVVEAIGALVAAAAVLVFGVSWTAFATAVFGWALVALAFIDLETGYLPDAITLPLGIAGLGVNAASLFVPFSQASIGAVAGFAAFWVIGSVFEALRGKEGLGQGDKKLLAAIGAWGGWMILPAVVLIGAITTLVSILAAKAFGKGTAMDQPIAFGPGLCAAGFIALLFEPRLFSAL